MSLRIPIPPHSPHPATTEGKHNLLTNVKGTVDKWNHPNTIRHEQIAVSSQLGLGVAEDYFNTVRVSDLGDLDFNISLLNSDALWAAVERQANWQSGQLFADPFFPKPALSWHFTYVNRSNGTITLLDNTGENGFFYSPNGDDDGIIPPKSSATFQLLLQVPSEEGGVPLRRYFIRVTPAPTPESQLLPEGTNILAVPGFALEWESGDANFLGGTRVLGGTIIIPNGTISTTRNLTLPDPLALLAFLGISAPGFNPPAPGFQFPSFTLHVINQSFGAGEDVVIDSPVGTTLDIIPLAGATATIANSTSAYFKIYISQDGYLLTRLSELPV